MLETMNYEEAKAVFKPWNGKAVKLWKEPKAVYCISKGDGRISVLAQCHKDYHCGPNGILSYTPDTARYAYTAAPEYAVELSALYLNKYRIKEETALANHIKRVKADQANLMEGITT